MFIYDVQRCIIADMKNTTLTLFAETLFLTFAEQGNGQAFLILHGGAGPVSVAGLAEALSQNAHVVVPTHPGFNREPRPDRFTQVDDLALAYLALIERLELSRVVVIGNSVGGWIAAEMALRQSPRVAGLVLLNAVGIDTGSSAKTIVDPATLSPADRLALVFHDQKRFAAAPPTPEAAAIMTENQRTLRVYGGDFFSYEPTLRGRLAQMLIPALVVWGESDRIVDVDYGRLYASSIPGARFELVSEAGHLPQIERREEVVRLIGEFTSQL